MTQEPKSRQRARWVNVVGAGVTWRHLTNISASPRGSLRTQRSPASPSVKSNRKRTHFRTRRVELEGFAGMIWSEETLGAT